MTTTRQGVAAPRRCRRDPKQSQSQRKAARTWWYCPVSPKGMVAVPCPPKAQAVVAAPHPTKIKKVDDLPRKRPAAATADGPAPAYKLMRYLMHVIDGSAAMRRTGPSRRQWRLVLVA